jgi:hypothetical protein
MEFGQPQFLGQISVLVGALETCWSGGKMKAKIQNKRVEQQLGVMVKVE